MKKKNSDVLIEILSSGVTSPDQVPEGPWRSWVISWLFKEPMMDGDLIERIRELRRGSESLPPKIQAKEVRAFLEAWRSPQYHRFIRHLFYSFCDPSAKVAPVRSVDPGYRNCVGCGTKLLEWREWSQICDAVPGESDLRNHLAIGSTTSKVCLCTRCLLQVKALYGFLSEIDPETVSAYPPAVTKKGIPVTNAGPGPSQPK